MKFGEDFLQILFFLTFDKKRENFTSPHEVYHVHMSLWFKNVNNHFNLYNWWTKVHH